MRVPLGMLRKHRKIAAAVLCNVVGAGLLWTGMSRFDALMFSGSSFAEPKSGRVYQLYNHGDVSYVTAEEYWSVRGFEIAGSVIGAIGVLLYVSWMGGFGSMRRRTS